MSTLRTELADLHSRSVNAFKVTGDRLKKMELRFASGTPIGKEEAGRLSEAVNFIANELQERGKQKPYMEVWAALKIRYSIADYKSLPMNQFSDALDWLNRWAAAVVASPKTVKPPD